MDETSLKPFYPNVCIQIRAALADVRPEIRYDGVEFLRRLVDFPIFETQEVYELMRSLMEINSSLIGNQSNRSKKGNAVDIRSALYECIEHLLESLCNRKKDVEEGYIDPSQWTLSSLLSRNFTTVSSTISEDLRKFITVLYRQGEDVVGERVEKMATECEILGRRVVVESAVDSKLTSKKKSGPPSSAFSKLSLLMRDDSD
jgi:hypothetical protein